MANERKAKRFEWLFSATTISITMLCFAFVCGLVSALLWERSNASWESHLDNAFNLGVALYGNVSAIRQNGDSLLESDSLRLSIVQPKQTEISGVRQLKFDVPASAIYETSFALLSQTRSRAASADRVDIRVYSSDFQYSISALSNEKNGIAFQFGELSRSIAKLCSDATVFVALDDVNWLKARAPDVWSCEARPADLRLPALMLAALTLGVMFSVANMYSQMLDGLAGDVRKAATSGSIDEIPERGVTEVRGLTAAINLFFSSERRRLEERAMLLSGISHDLGTPATRLKLRTALIDEKELREKLDRDIDQMTDMIDGVLTYTRHEMDTEEPRKISMRSLVESIVDDYQDIGKPVHLVAHDHVNLERLGSVFNQTSESTHILIRDHQRVLCRCKPNAIRRALTNLIENALKYGGEARVELSSSADQFSISVTDKGLHGIVQNPERMVEPFVRGENAQQQKGAGLGLTITNSVVKSHGGTLDFEQLSEGLMVRMTMPRWI
jgi:signal transduction histidine kinase